MSLFKKKMQENNSSNCNIHMNSQKNCEENADIKILGSGCAKCNQLEQNTIEALKQLGRNTKIQHITDFAEIANYGVMTTPAIVYNGKVISYGKVLKTEEIIKLL